MATTTTNKTVAALPKSVFAVNVANHELLKLAYDAYLANSRTAGATTKTRGLVSGGGRKPWRQKGTGRARFGSTRNPIWRKGGVAFGPLGVENYTKRLSTTAKRTALRQALTVASQDGKIHVTELPKLGGKTKELAAFLNNGKFNTKRVLLVVEHKTPELLRAGRNLQNVEIVKPTFISVYHLLNADSVIMEPAAVKAIEAWLAPAAATKQQGGSK